MKLNYFEAMSLILLTLRLLGYIDCKWIVVFLPIIIDCVLSVLKAIALGGGVRDDD